MINNQGDRYITAASIDQFDRYFNIRINYFLFSFLVDVKSSGPASGSGQPTAAGQLTDDKTIAGQLADDKKASGQLTDVKAAAGQLTDDKKASGQLTDDKKAVGQLGDDDGAAQDEDDSGDNADLMRKGESRVFKLNSQGSCYKGDRIRGCCAVHNVGKRILKG